MTTDETVDEVFVVAGPGRIVGADGTDYGSEQAYMEQLRRRITEAGSAKTLTDALSDYVEVRLKLHLDTKLREAPWRMIDGIAYVAVDAIAPSYRWQAIEPVPPRRNRWSWLRRIR